MRSAFLNEIHEEVLHEAEPPSSSDVEEAAFPPSRDVIHEAVPPSSPSPVPSQNKNDDDSSPKGHGSLTPEELPEDPVVRAPSSATATSATQQSERPDELPEEPAVRAHFLNASGDVFEVSILQKHFQPFEQPLLYHWKRALWFHVLNTGSPVNWMEKTIPSFCWICILDEDTGEVLGDLWEPLDFFGDAAGTGEGGKQASSSVGADSAEDRGNAEISSQNTTAGAAVLLPPASTGADVPVLQAQPGKNRSSSPKELHRGPPGVNPPEDSMRSEPTRPPPFPAATPLTTTRTRTPAPSPDDPQ